MTPPDAGKFAISPDRGALSTPPNRGASFMTERQNGGSAMTRRTLLRRGGAMGAMLALPGLGDAVWAASASAAIRPPDSLPNPGVPAGTVDTAMPFDHIVVVMMENHSFDNLLGALPRFGQRRADGLTFNRSGVPTNSNPGASGTVSSFAF